MSDIVERLLAPSYWISGSDEGHEGDNNAPIEAAKTIESLRSELAKVNIEVDLLSRTFLVNRYLFFNLLEAGVKAAARIQQLEAALRVSERDATRIALEAQKVCLQNIQMKFALGYPMPAELERHILPDNPLQCGVCAARKASMGTLLKEDGKWL